MKSASRGFSTFVRDGAGISVGGIAGLPSTTRRSFGSLSSNHTFRGMSTTTTTTTTTPPYLGGGGGGGLFGKDITLELKMVNRRRNTMGMMWSRRAMGLLLFRRPCC